jgi:hypothetical protein
MNPLAFIAEQRIAQAMKEKDLTDSEWKNKPLPLHDDPFVPEDLKMAYKLLKNSGYLPPEIEERKEVERLEDLIVSTEDEHERVKQMKKLSFLLMKVDAKRNFSSNIANQQDYYRKVVERVTVRRKSKKE